MEKLDKGALSKSTLESTFVFLSNESELQFHWFVGNNQSSTATHPLSLLPLGPPLSRMLFVSLMAS